MTTIAVFGDLHGRFDAEDVAWLDAQDFDAILFTGDLSGWRPGEEARIAGIIGSLETPAFVVPGNHDAVTMPQLGAEVQSRVELADRLGQGMEERVVALRAALGNALLGGWTRHDLGGVQLVTGRPHSHGGPRICCGGYVARTHGITDLGAAADRTSELLLACDAERPVIVLAHNGPAGLGAHRDDPFGCDFSRTAGDWGDRDLEVALDRAEAGGRWVAAVAAGHMHHTLSGGGTRRRFAVRGRTVVVNAARVPRIEREGRRHHVELEVSNDRVAAFAVSRKGALRFRTALATAGR